MHNELCERLGIEFPIFAFTHCRDVAAAVTNAGGLGVLGAVGFSADELEVELTWLDEHVGDRPYGVDIVITGKYEGMDEIDPVKLEGELRAMVPEEHRTFAKKILADHGVPELEGGPRRELLGWTAATAAPLVEVILRHPKVKLVANALGTPPDDVIAQVHDHGMLMAALAGSVKHALHHKAAGVDIVICQGSEGGGHTGDVGSIVLWPEVIDAVAPLPVLAAGGIGSGRQMAAAMVMGAAGVWTGSLWLALGTHAAWNLFEGPVYGLPVSGLALSPAPVITLSISGPSWLTGANFGPEAGLSSLLALAIGALVLRALKLRGVFSAQADTREAYARS